MASFVTDFADQALLLPVAAGVAVLLASSGWRRGLIAWLIAIGGTLGTMLVLKLAVMACGQRLPTADLLHSPSGHTAAASAVYGGLIAIALRRWVAPTRAALPCAAAVALAIGASRLALHVHTALEVGIGAAVGLAGAMAFCALAGAPPATHKPGRLVLVALTIIVLAHGVRMPAEAAIRSMAADIWPLSQCRDAGTLPG